MTGPSNDISKLIEQYSKTWEILLRYDEQHFAPTPADNSMVDLPYDEAILMIQALKKHLIQKHQASDLFGQERAEALASILGNIRQTFDGVPVYPSHMERAANLFYMIIKDHPFTDGNKRIACLLCVIYLKKAMIEVEPDHNALASLALLVAESAPSQKDTMISLIISLWNN